MNEECEHCGRKHSIGDLFPLRFSIGAEFATSYFRHGYMQQDRGMILQPSLAVSTQPISAGKLSIEPYFTWWNSIHSDQSPGYAGGHGGHTRVEQEYQQYLDQPHSGAPLPHYHTRLVDVIKFDDAGGGWFETQLMPGVTLTQDPVRLDLKLKACFFPSNFHDTMIEAGGKFTFDAAWLWNHAPDRPFSLFVGASAFAEVKDDNGDLETIVEPFIEPTWRTSIGSRALTLALPITAGIGPDGYYRNTANQDESLGYVSAALRMTLQLNSGSEHGRWFLNSTLTYTHLLADSAIFANGGDDHAVYASIGIGVII
jgi:hypothetical protein